MIIVLGECCDVILSKEYPDRLIVTAYGHDPSVVMHSTVPRTRTDAKAVKCVLDESDLGDSIARRFYHLLPHGEYALDPFPDGSNYDEERLWNFVVNYTRTSDKRQRTATVTLRASCDGGANWSADVDIEGVIIDAGALETLNWYPIQESWRGLGCHRTWELLDERNG